MGYKKYITSKEKQDIVKFLSNGNLIFRNSNTFKRLKNKQIEIENISKIRTMKNRFLIMSQKEI